MYYLWLCSMAAVKLICVTYFVVFCVVMAFYKVTGEVPVDDDEPTEYC